MADNSVNTKTVGTGSSKNGSSICRVDVMNFDSPESSDLLYQCLEIPEKKAIDPTVIFQEGEVAYVSGESILTKTALGVPVGSTFPLEFTSDKSISFLSLPCEIDDGLSSDFSALDNQTYLPFRTIPGTDKASDESATLNKVEAIKKHQKSLDYQQSSSIKASNDTEFPHFEKISNKKKSLIVSSTLGSSEDSCRHKFPNLSDISKEQNWKELQLSKSVLHSGTDLNSLSSEGLISDENFKLQILTEPKISKLSISSENGYPIDSDTAAEIKPSSENYTPNSRHVSLSKPENKLIQAKKDQINSMKTLIDRQQQSYIRKLQREVHWLQKVEKLLLEAQQNRFDVSFSTASDTDVLPSKHHLTTARTKTKCFCKKIPIKSASLSNKNSKTNSTSENTSCQFHTHPGFLGKNKDYGKWASALLQTTEHKSSPETSSLEQYPLFYLKKDDSESEVIKNFSDSNSAKSVLSVHENRFVKFSPKSKNSDLLHNFSNKKVVENAARNSEGKQEIGNKFNKAQGNSSKNVGKVTFGNASQSIDTNRNYSEIDRVQPSVSNSVNQMTAGTDNVSYNIVDQIYQRCQICQSNSVKNHCDFLKKQDFKPSQKIKTIDNENRKVDTVHSNKSKEIKISEGEKFEPFENGNWTVKYCVHSLHNKENKSTETEKISYSVGIQTSPLLAHLEQLEGKFIYNAYKKKEEDRNQVSTGASERVFVSLPVSQKAQKGQSVKRVVQNKNQYRHYRKFVRGSCKNPEEQSDNLSGELCCIRNHEVTLSQQRNHGSAETKSVSWFIPLSDEYLPWFQPRGTADGENDGSKEPTTLHVCKIGNNQDESPRHQQFNLQEAFHYFKSSFIVKSKAREQKMKIAARRRNIGVQTQADIHSRIRSCNIKSHPIFDQLHKPSKRIFTHQEMRLQTERKFQCLPEHIGEIDKKRIKETYTTNRLMAQMYTRKIQKRTLRGQVSYMITDKFL